MSDYSKLKELAEAATGLSDVSLAPDVVLALIAENERIKARLCVCRDCGGQGEIYSGHSSYQGYNQPPEPDMDVCGTCGGDGVLGPIEDFESLAAERDRLKAECEGLRESLTHAADEVESWGSYASDYFQQKHDLAGTVLKVRQAAVSKESGQ